MYLYHSSILRKGIFGCLHRSKCCLKPHYAEGWSYICTVCLCLGSWAMTDTLENAKQIPPLLEVIASPFHYTFSLFHVLGFLEVTGTDEVGVLHLGQERSVLIKASMFSFCSWSLQFRTSLNYKNSYQFSPPQTHCSQVFTCLRSSSLLVLLEFSQRTRY